MRLSSRNRSIFNTFRHILPCVAPVCEVMHYHKNGVPWQMKSIFIIVLFLLDLPRMPCFARVSGVIVICSENADCGKSGQDPASCYYRLVVKLEVKRWCYY
nr:MAG TPA: hypothetical protein [Caudoviricetes sp.]